MYIPSLTDIQLLTQYLLISIRRLLRPLFRPLLEHGWSLPLPPNFSFHLPHAAEVVPHCIVSQYTITENCVIFNKARVSHNQFYHGQHSKKSINSRVTDEDLAEYMFGYMYLRFTHCIICYQHRHPLLRIWMSKIDCTSAYLCQHVNTSTAVNSLTQVIIDNCIYLLMALCLTFGGKPYLCEWGYI